MNINLRIALLDSTDISITKNSIYLVKYGYIEYVGLLTILFPSIILARLYRFKRA